MMVASKLSAVLLSLCVSGASAGHLTPRFPPPSDLSSHDSLILKSWKNITSVLQKGIDGKIDAQDGIFSELKNITFSLGMFSLHDKSVNDFQFHYTSPEIKQSEDGTNEVDGDSIYRIASITKVFTVLAGILEFQDGEWDRPISDFVPNLAEYAREHPNDPTASIQWDKITLAALGAQIAGIPRGGFPYEDAIMPYVNRDFFDSIAYGSQIYDPLDLGLPPFDLDNDSVVSPCFKGDSVTCGGDGFTETAKARSPLFLPWTTPVYANHGFELLGLALANITGRHVGDVWKDDIFDPLGMASTSGDPVDGRLHRVVVPVGVNEAGYTRSPSTLIGSGGMLSTINDLNKFGVSIVNSTLLPDDVTRQWMKPVSHTDRFEYSMGRPWEIFRFQHPKTSIITDMYTKSGSSGLYSSYLIVLPQYDAGFTILSAGTSADRSTLVSLLADVMTENLVVALEAQAAVEAKNNFEGQYISATEGLNSSLCIAQNETTGDLQITSWISNSTDLMPFAVEHIGGGRAPRLLSSIPNTGDGKMGFVLENVDPSTPEIEQLGPFRRGDGLSRDYMSVGALTFSGIGLSQMVFDVDKSGKVIAVTPLVTKAKLKKSG